MLKQQCNGVIKIRAIAGDVTGAENTVNAPGLKQRQCFRHRFRGRMHIAE
jgi:hypothetical protein